MSHTGQQYTTRPPNGLGHVIFKNNDTAKVEQWESKLARCLDLFDRDGSAASEKSALYNAQFAADRDALAERELRLFNPAMSSSNGWEDSDKDKEVEAARALQTLKEWDEKRIARLPPRDGYQGQKHARFVGDHFLTNAEWIRSESWVFKAAQEMPKGAHLHVHFNSCLRENFLLDLAMEDDQLRHMYIKSKCPLSSPEGFQEREIQFSMLPDNDPQVQKYSEYRTRLLDVKKRMKTTENLRGAEKTRSELRELMLTHESSIWSLNYYKVKRENGGKPLPFPPYKFEDFLDEFAMMYREAHDGLEYIPLQQINVRNEGKNELAEKHVKTCRSWSAQLARDWLIAKLLFQEQEAHNSCQTVLG